MTAFQAGFREKAITNLVNACRYHNLEIPKVVKDRDQQVDYNHPFWYIPTLLDLKPKELEALVTQINYAEKETKVEVIRSN